jgi:hypothetical protein
MRWLTELGTLEVGKVDLPKDKRLLVYFAENHVVYLYLVTRTEHLA